MGIKNIPYKPGYILNAEHPGAQLSTFSAPTEDTQERAKGAFAALATMRNLHKRWAPRLLLLKYTPLDFVPKVSKS